MVKMLKQIWTGIPADPKVVREFGFILTGFFLAAPAVVSLGIGVLILKRPFHYWPGWPLVSAAAFVVNLFSKPLMAFIYRLAMVFAKSIGWVVMRVMLSLLFFGVVTPMAVIMRALGKDFLDETINREAPSYWQKRPAKRPKEDYERLF